MGVLANRQFRLLYAGQAASLLGDGFYYVALAFAVLQSTGSKASLGIVLAAGTLPLATFILVGGVWADRLPRRRIMVVADVVRMAAQGLLALLVWRGTATTELFVVLAVVYGTAQAFFQPAATGLLPEIVPAEDIARANGLVQATRSITQIAGAGLAGVLVDVSGPAGAIALDAGSFAFSAACLLALRPPPRTPADRQSFVTELREGWHEVRARRWLWLGLLLVGIFLMLVVAPLEVLGPIVSQAGYGGATAWGLMSASFSVGMGIGAAAVMLGRFRRPMLIATTLFLITPLTPVLLANVAPLPAVLALWFVEGLAVGLFTTTWEAAIQTQIPGEVLSRVAAWDWLGALAGMPIGFALTAPAIGLVGEETLLYAIAVIGVVVNSTFILTPEIRRLGERPRAA